MSNNNNNNFDNFLSRFQHSNGNSQNKSNTKQKGASTNANDDDYGTPGVFEFPVSARREQDENGNDKPVEMVVVRDIMNDYYDKSRKEEFDDDEATEIYEESSSSSSTEIYEADADGNVDIDENDRTLPIIQQPLEQGSNKMTKNTNNSSSGTVQSLNVNSEFQPVQTTQPLESSLASPTVTSGQKTNKGSPKSAFSNQHQQQPLCSSPSMSPTSLLLLGHDHQQEQKSTTTNGNSSHHNHNSFLLDSSNSPKSPRSKRSVSSTFALLLEKSDKKKSVQNNSQQQQQESIVIDDDDDDEDDDDALLLGIAPPSKNNTIPPKNATAASASSKTTSSATIATTVNNNNNNNNQNETHQGNNSSGSWLVNDMSASSTSLTSTAIQDKNDTNNNNIEHLFCNFPYEAKEFPSQAFRWKNRKAREKVQELLEDSFISRLAADRRMFDAFSPFMSKKYEKRIQSRLEEATNGDDNDDGFVTPLLYMKDMPLVAERGDPIAHSPTVGFTLRSYQIEGVNFLLRNFSRGIASLLCDDMGLGKTCQVCCFLHALYARCKLQGPHLIVVPLSTMSSWRRELERWAPSLEVTLYKGTPAQRNQLQVPGPRVFITTPSTFNSDHKFFISRVWGAIVVDEAQILKSDSTSINKYASKLSACGKVGLTGTPVANSAAELWALMNFLFPDLRKNAGTPDYDEDDEDVKSDAKKILKYIMLRRTKQDILKDLPPKTVHPTCLVDPSHVQALAMEKLFLKSSEFVAKKILRSFILNVLKLNNHPLLFGLLALKFRGETGSSSKTAVGRSELMKRRERGERMIDENGFKLTQGLDLLLDSGADITNEHEIVTSSSKMVKLDEILSNLQKTVDVAWDPSKETTSHALNRVLIFSRFSTQLDILEGFCVLRGYRYERLDGSTFHAEREIGMARFNHPKSQIFIYLITTTAGGVGVTLTGANHVIFYDTTYNPQVDRQAADRAHRIGQTRVTHIHRLCVAGSIEERVLETANRKAKMGDFVIDGITSNKNDDNDENESSSSSEDEDETSDDDVLLISSSTSDKKKQQQKKKDVKAKLAAQKKKEQERKQKQQQEQSPSKMTKNPLTELTVGQIKSMIAEAAGRNKLQLQKQEELKALKAERTKEERKAYRDEGWSMHDESPPSQSSPTAKRRPREEEGAWVDKEDHHNNDNENSNSNTTSQQQTSSSQEQTSSQQDQQNQQQQLATTLRITLTQEEAQKYDDQMAQVLVDRILEAVVGENPGDDDDGSDVRRTKLFTDVAFKDRMQPSQTVQSTCFSCKKVAHPVSLLHCVGCVKSYHMNERCLAGQSRPHQPTNWSCPRHRCSECGASGANIVTFTCIDCVQAYCIDCLPATYLDMTDGDGSDLPYVSSRYENMEEEGMLEKRTMKYIRCEVCAHKKRVADGESDEEDEDEDGDNNEDAAEVEVELE